MATGAARVGRLGSDRYGQARCGLAGRGVVAWHGGPARHGMVEKMTARREREEGDEEGRDNQYSLFESYFNRLIIITC